MYKLIIIFIAAGALLATETLVARGGGRTMGGRVGYGARGAYRAPTMSRAATRGAVAGAAVANNRNANNSGGYVAPVYYYPETPYYNNTYGYPPN